MSSFVALARVSSAARTGLSCSSQKWLHQSAVRSAITNMRMPAMSPTMSEGGIASWKKREGDTFTTGDVLLEVETDKATIDVEAQDDGVVGKIIVDDGAKNVPVGKVIAMLAEEGDDISNLQPPKEEEAAAATPPPAPAPASTPEPAQPQAAAPETAPEKLVVIEGSKPLFPSVYRLLTENGISNPDSIKGTGVRGMLTKGDVLSYLGKASGPTGTFHDANASPAELEASAHSTSTSAATAAATTKKQEAPKVLDGADVRKLIVNSMLKASKARRAQPPIVADFDSVIADYLPPSSSPAPTQASAATKLRPGFLDGII